MDYFFTNTADQEPVTIAIDEQLELALVVVGGDENAWSKALPIPEAFMLKGEIEIFDIDETWALVAAIRDLPQGTPGEIRAAACKLLEPIDYSQFES